MRSISPIVLAAIILFSTASASAEGRFLGGFEACVSVDALGYAYAPDISQILSLGASIKAFTVPFRGIRYLGGISLLSNVMNAGWLLSIGAERPIPIGTRFSFDPGVSLGLGFRSEDYIMIDYRFLGMLAAELPLIFAFNGHFSCRLGAKAALAYRSAWRYAEYRGAFRLDPDLDLSLPFFLGFRYSL